MKKALRILSPFLTVVAIGWAQTSPNVSQVLMYSSVTPTLNVGSGASAFTLQQSVPNLFTETGTTVNLLVPSNGTPVANPGLRVATNYSVTESLAELNSALNAGIASALSIVPLASPASAVITRLDPLTGAEIPGDATLGPIFTERAETLGKGKFYIGVSNQDLHFTKYNGTSLNALSILYKGGDPSNIKLNGTNLSTVPVTFGLGADVKLSQNIALVTYGLTNNFDISVGLPMVHSAVEARTYNGMIYVGNGFATNNSGCWGTTTFTPSVPLLEKSQFGLSSLGKTGFGDVLLRGKGMIVSKPNVVLAVGADLRFPTGDASNYLGVGTTTVKPFVAASFYTKPLKNGVVLSPHFDAGWEFGGKSILGGTLEAANLTATTASGNINYDGAPFTASKGYLPDVLTWDVGAEFALGHRNTIVFDMVGNEVGIIHGIPNAVNQSISGVPLPTGPAGDNTGVAVPTTGTAAGLVGVGRVSFGEYSASFGYKTRLVGKMVATFNLLYRLDNNGLTARLTPLYGLGYTF